MTLNTKRFVIAFLGLLFMVSLVFVQWMEVARKRKEAGLDRASVAVPANSKGCVDCHTQTTPGLVDHWVGSTHAIKGVGCVECHQAERGDADGFLHYGEMIATVVTPRDCGRCHQKEAEEFQRSHHAKGGHILHSLDNFLAETVEGSRVPFNPHGPAVIPGGKVDSVEGMASVIVGCKQCHGSKLALEGEGGSMITVDDLKPGPDGKPTNKDALARIVKDASGKPRFHTSSWPNTGIGRINLDGSLGSCSACHSRHDFSPRRARQPENCGKCHMGPDHPQKEIYESSKHGVAFRDLKASMNLDADAWVLGDDYSAAPTCATCHMSANTRNGREITHDPGTRISWSNRPPLSLVMDTDVNGKIVTETDPGKRQQLVVDTAIDKRNRMKLVCGHCHTPDYVDAFYKQYDDFVTLYNEKFARPGQLIMDTLSKEGLITPVQFDEKVEWIWYYLWHHEGRRARHGASMMSPDYAHWHGMFEVAERFYMELIPEVRKIIEKKSAEGMEEAAARAAAVVDEIMARPEHAWKKGQ